MGIARRTIAVRQRAVIAPNTAKSEGRSRADSANATDADISRLSGRPVGVRQHRARKALAPESWTWPHDGSAPITTVYPVTALKTIYPQDHGTATMKRFRTPRPKIV